MLKSIVSVNWEISNILSGVKMIRQAEKLTSIGRKHRKSTQLSMFESFSNPQSEAVMSACGKSPRKACQNEKMSAM